MNPIAIALVVLVTVTCEVESMLGQRIPSSRILSLTSAVVHWTMEDSG